MMVQLVPLCEMKRVSPRPTGGLFLVPYRFFFISAELMELSTRNLPNVSGHQFYTLSVNKNFVPAIGWPQITSEWWHVRAILMQNKGLQESLSWTKILCFNQYNAFCGRRTSERDSEPCTCEIAPGYLQ